MELLQGWVPKYFPARQRLDLNVVLQLLHRLDQVHPEAMVAGQFQASQARPALTSCKRFRHSSEDQAFWA